MTDHVPQGYKLVEVKLKEETLKLLACKSCGCPVLLPTMHTHWHKRHGG